MRKIIITAAGASAALVVVAGTVPADATGGAHHGRAAAAKGVPASPFKTVASGLNNPRQLNFSKSGKLYIAEAGTGGTDDCTIGGEGGTVCWGTTGSVTVVANGHQKRVMTGLPSYADQGAGTTALGPADVVPYKGKLAVSIGYGLDPAQRDALAKPGNRFGQIVRFDLGSKKLGKIGDLSAFEGKHNPGHSSPIRALRGGAAAPHGVRGARHGGVAARLRFSGGNSIQLSWGPIRHVVGHNIAAYHRNPDDQRIELFTELDIDAATRALGYFEPRPWHQDFPQRPKVWPADTLRAYWGFGSFGTFPGYRVSTTACNTSAPSRFPRAPLRRPRRQPSPVPHGCRAADRILRLAASARNSGSLTIVISAPRTASTRSRGTSGGIAIGSIISSEPRNSLSTFACSAVSARS